MAPTRWAMVGTGLMLHLIGRDFGLVDEVDLRVIVSRSAERAADAAQQFGIADSSGDFGEVLRRDDIDVVYVATPHSEHYEQAMAALRAGKHVLVEKSMTPSAADTRALCEYARSRGLFAMEAMWTAFNPVIVELRRRLAAGVIGDVGLVSTNFAINQPYQAGHRKWEPSLAGGSTLDQGVYPLSFAHMILGRPDSISAVGSVAHGVDVDVVATLGYASGAHAVCVTGMTSTSPLDAFVAGSLGRIDVAGPFWGTNQFVQHVGGAVDTFTVEREGMGYGPMLRAVNQAISEGRLEHDLRTHADTIAVAETMDEVLNQVHGR